jgi:hypothetical protein
LLLLSALSSLYLFISFTSLSSPSSPSSLFHLSFITLHHSSYLTKRALVQLTLELELADEAVVLNAKILVDNICLL